MGRQGGTIVLMRYLGLDGNPLRRPVDRIDSWATVILLLTLLVVGPIVTWRAGTLANREEPTRSVTVQAVLEENVVALPTAAEFAIQPRALPVQARWNAPDGTPRAGKIEPDSGGRAGTVVEIRTDAAGNVIPAALEEQRVAWVFLAGLIALLSLASVVVCVRLGLNRLLDRWRLAYWRHEWTMVEPRWSGRR